MRSWLDRLEFYRSKSTQSELRLYVKTESDWITPQSAAQNAETGSIRKMIQSGEMTVDTADGASALDIPDDSSSITIGASTPEADDGDIDKSNKDT